jgi:hypothetical protein
VLIFLLHTDFSRIYPLPDFSGFFLGRSTLHGGLNFLCPCLQAYVFLFSDRPSFPLQSFAVQAIFF